MKFKTIGTANFSDAELQADYEAADRKEKIRLGEKCVYISHALSAEYLPYTSIERVFRRLEDVCAKLCCGVVPYEVHHLVMICGGEEVAVRFEDKACVISAMEKIALMNPAVLVGKEG